VLILVCRYKPTPFNVAIVALLRTSKSITMIVQMYLLMVSDAAFYVWSFIVSTLIAFAIGLWIDAETTLMVLNHC
jgi:hypothetical protein